MSLRECLIIHLHENYPKPTPKHVHTTHVCVCVCVSDGAPRVGEALQGIKLVPSHIKEELAAALTSHGCALTVIRDGTFPLRYGGCLCEMTTCL